MAEKKIAVSFFKNDNGREPVLDWLKSLTSDERKKIGAAIRTVELGWPLGMPTCRNLKNGLHEVRVNLPGKWARVLFFVKDAMMILLHGFMKKTNATPKGAIDKALDRMKRFNDNTS